jgi:hypothetical protein
MANPFCKSGSPLQQSALKQPTSGAAVRLAKVQQFIQVIDGLFMKLCAGYLDLDLTS